MTPDKPTLSPADVLLKGAWVEDESGVRSDAVCERINAILPSLRRRAVSPDGDCTLLQDPADGRYWEHSYPQSEGHGGGAPQLEHVSGFYARSKYELESQDDRHAAAFSALCASVERTCVELISAGDAALAKALERPLRHVEWASLDELIKELNRQVEGALLRENSAHLRWVLTNLSLGLARFTSPASPGLPGSREP